MQRIYGLIWNKYDDEHIVLWFKDKERYAKLLTHNIEAFDGPNPNGFFELQFPDDLDLEKAGFTFQDGTDIFDFFYHHESVWNGDGVQSGLSYSDGIPEITELQAIEKLNH